MAGDTGILGALSRRLRRVDARLHADGSGPGRSLWLIPALTFGGIVALFAWLGVASGVWAAEYIPTGLVIGSVIAGLVVTCLTPGSDPPVDGGGGDGGWGPDPGRGPAPDPSVWVRLLADADLAPLGRSERDPAPPVPAGVGACGHGDSARMENLISG